MGWRFRRRIRIAPGVHLNVGKRGITSASVGRRGAALNVSKHGVYQHLGVPGTGLSYRRRLTGTGKHEKGEDVQSSGHPVGTGPTNVSLAPPPGRDRRKLVLYGAGGLLGLCVLLGIIGAIAGGGDDDDDDQPATRSNVAALPTGTTAPAATATRPAPTVAPQSTAAGSATTPTTIPSGAGGPEASFVEINGGPPGGDASVIVQTAPGTTCDLDYFTPSGNESDADGLDDATAGADGRIRWEWSIGPGTDPGTGTVRVTCGGTTAIADITIE